MQGPNYKKKKVEDWTKVWILGRNVEHSEATRVFENEFRDDLKLHIDQFDSDSIGDSLKSLDMIQLLKIIQSEANVILHYYIDL